MARPNRIDEDALSALGGELLALAREIRVTSRPAAERLGCARLIEQLEAATSSDTPGTLRSLAAAIGVCLADVHGEQEP